MVLLGTRQGRASTNKKLDFLGGMVQLDQLENVNNGVLLYALEVSGIFLFHWIGIKSINIMALAPLALVYLPKSDFNCSFQLFIVY